MADVSENPDVAKFWVKNWTAPLPPFTNDIPPVQPISDREDLLLQAIRAITQERNNQYGPPTQDFTRVAALLNALGFAASGEPVEGHHVAIIMMALKMSRLTWGPGKMDSWLDIAGYAGCGWEVFEATK